MNILEKIRNAVAGVKKIVIWAAGNRKLRFTAVLVLIAFAAFQLGGSFSGKSGGGSAAVAHDDHTHVEDENGMWTCSMHPQVILPNPGQCPICFMDLIPMESGGTDDKYGERALSLSESAKRLSSIVTAPVESRSGDVSVKLTGKVVPDESLISVISSRMGGRIDRLHVNETGALVRNGAVLATLYSPELLALQQELISASSSTARLGASASALIRNSAQANLEAAKEKLRLLGFSGKELDDILGRNRPSEHMTIRSNQAGIVLERKVSQGDYVKEGTALFHIADLSRVWVLLDAYEKDLAHIRVGQNVEFNIAAYPGETFSGTISFIDPVINPATRTASVRVVVNNREQKLKPEMFLSAQVNPGDEGVRQMGSDSDPVVIPATAPLFTGERAIVYVEIATDEDGSVYEAREILLGPRTGDSYIVKSGLKRGERVVVHGAFRIDSELQIRGRPSMMSPEGGTPGGGHNHGGASEHTAAGYSDGHAEELVISKLTEVSSEFINSLDQVYDAYFDLSRSLSGDDQEDAVVFMGVLSEKLGAVNAGTGESYKEWTELKGTLDEVLVHRDHFGGIEESRKAFNDISQKIIHLQRVYGHSTGKHYLAFCPMALGDKGAYWLQNEEQIDNPYFGASMLRCGEIKEAFTNDR